MTRVLITGAGGFVGSHVLRHFLDRTDWDLVVTDSFRRTGSLDRIDQQVKDKSHRNRLQVVAANLQHPFSPQLCYVIGDLDYIVNVASDSDVDRSITEPRECIENNVQVMLSVLDYALQHPVKRIIQVSTDEVYGPAPNGYLHKEGEPHRPSNPYSASKAAQEDICFSYWRTYGMPIVISNTMNIVGEMQDCAKFVPMTIRKVLAGETVQIHASPEGQIGSRFYLHARNQADALLFLLNYAPESTADVPRFNVVGEKEVTNLEMALLIADCLGKELHYEVDFHTSRPGHDLRYALDGSKMAAIGWKAPVPFRESLERTVRWTRDHPEWLLTAKRASSLA